MINEKEAHQLLVLIPVYLLCVAGVILHVK